MPLLPLLLFFTPAAANFTTSYYLPRLGAGANHIKLFASVIAAENDRLTLAATYSDPPSNIVNVDQTFTLAPTLYARSDSFVPYTGITYQDSISCAIQPASSSGGPVAGAACSASVNSIIAMFQGCYRDPIRTGSLPTAWSPIPWTFSDTDTAGVQTISVSVPGRDTAPPPDWCSNYSQNVSLVSVPLSAMTSSYTLDGTQLELFTFTITAGEEKIPRAAATTGASAGVGSVTPTGTGGGADTPASETSGTVGAAPLRTVAPALAGLGAAIAVFL